MSTQMPTTTLGTFSVLNYTRYCTEDLVAILNVLEAAVPQMAYVGGKPAVATYGNRAGGPTEAVTIVFKDFTGVPVYDYTYTSGQRIKGKKFILAKRRWNAPFEFRLLPPERIHDNPVEALALATEQTPTLPESMRDEVVQRMTGMFAAYEPYGTFRGQITAPKVDLTIRIFKRRAANAPKRNRRVQMIERAVNRSAAVSYRLHSASKTCDNLRDAVVAMHQTAAQLGISSADRSHMVLFDLLDRIKTESERISAAVRELQ